MHLRAEVLRITAAVAVATVLGCGSPAAVAPKNPAPPSAEKGTQLTPPAPTPMPPSGEQGP